MSSLSLLALGEPRGFAPDRRFAIFSPLVETPAQSDPVDDAYSRGHADGFAEALALADRREAEAEAGRERIQLALGRLDEQCAAELQEQLRQTVLVLCENALAPLAVDPVGLAQRVAKAVSILQRKRDDCLLRLHPDDHSLVASRLPEDLPFEPDATLERGALRIETADGGVEDGPQQWRAILIEALRAC